MAKRFTDTNKWDKPWYRRMPAEYKCLWDFILSKCDIAGVWEVDFEGAGYHIGANISQKKAREFFEEHIHVMTEKKWFIIDFVKFQYGDKPLNLKSPIHKKVDEILTKYSLHDRLHSTLGGRLHGSLKEEDKEEEQEEDKVEEKEKEKRDNILIDSIIDYMNEVVGSEFKKTGSANRKVIKARLNEKHTRNDFEAVISYKFNQWGLDPKMREYLRPETLFGPKFESYLQASKITPAPPGYSLSPILKINEELKEEINKKYGAA